jgi:Protein of unknown function (DUF4038)/Putative collagen-binding domain of a collagenase/Cep192 domain 4
MKRFALFIAIVFAVFALPSTIAQTMQLDTTKTYLVDPQGRPVFWLSDAAWSLIVQLSSTDAEYYLADRQSRGFSAAIVELIDHKYGGANSPANIAGDLPFTMPGNLTTPNEAYFAHADDVIQRAANHGITVLLAPLYLGYQCSDDGWCAEVRAASTASITSYGTYLGNRYKSVPNIVWLMGGDMNAVTYGVDAKVTALANAIRATGDTHLMTYHCGRNCSAMDAFPSATWLDLNNVYCDLTTEISMAVSNYQRTGAKPLFEIEDVYENDTGRTPTALDIRRERYQAVLSGATLGENYGNSLVFAFSSPGVDTTPWKPQLGSAGAVAQQYAGKLFRSREFWKMVPDLTHTVLTANYGSGVSQSVAARSSDGQTIIAYFPGGSASAKTFDMSKITSSTSQVTGWWYNPSSGASTEIGTFSNSGTHSFTEPDGNDWVLVLDDASKGLPAPGASDILSGGAVLGFSVDQGDLFFGFVNIGEAPQISTIQVRNNGPTALALPSLAVSGQNATDFSATPDPDCGAVAAGGSCDIRVSFNPQVAGPRSGTLSFSSLASNGSVVEILLNGTVADFGITTFSTASQAISSGQPAVFTVQLQPQGGTFSGGVALGCQPVGTSYGPCILDPATVVVAGVSKAAISAGNSAQRLVPFGAQLAIAIFVLPLGVILQRRAGRRKLRSICLLLFLALLSCGGGSGGSSGGGGTQPPPPSQGQTYTYKVTATAQKGTASHSSTFSFTVK